MPMGMPYPAGKMKMQGKPTMSQMMGIESGEHGKPMRNAEAVMRAETQEYGKRPASKAAMLRGERKEHGMRGKKK